MKLLSPIRQEKPWGYEDWIATTFHSCAQKEFCNVIKDFPLLVKIIKAEESLSLQVHPDDKKAVELEGKGNRGKTECWYILDAEKGAKLIYGFNKNYTNEEIEQNIKSTTLENLVNFVNVKKGDFIFIPSGTLHAIGSGITLLEVQQSCNTTYRLYDWGRNRELHIEKGISSLKNQKLPEIKELSDFECEYFSIQKKIVKGGYSFLGGTNIFNEKENIFLPELCYIDEGKNLSATFTDKNGNRTENLYLYEKQIFLIEKNEKITIEGNGSIIRIKPKTI